MSQGDRQYAIHMQNTRHTEFYNKTMISCSLAEFIVFFPILSLFSWRFHVLPFHAFSSSFFNEALHSDAWWQRTWRHSPPPSWTDSCSLADRGIIGKLVVSCNDSNNELSIVILLLYLAWPSSLLSLHYTVYGSLQNLSISLYSETSYTVILHVQKREHSQQERHGRIAYCQFDRYLMTLHARHSSDWYYDSRCPFSNVFQKQTGKLRTKIFISVTPCTTLCIMIE